MFSQVCGIARSQLDSKRLGFYLWTKLSDKSCRGAISKMDSTSKQSKGCHSARVQIDFVRDVRNFHISK